MTDFSGNHEEYISQGVVTLWFVTTADPKKVIATCPKADRGFGRKYLAQLNPQFPITFIGQFALNRSATASVGEFYIAGFPGISIVQTVIENHEQLSKLDPALLTSLPAADVYAFSIDTDTGLGGFAHWSGGQLRRSFCARRDRVHEDLGVPESFETPFWAGERAEQQGGIALPFVPIDLVHEAEQQWLGFDPHSGDDINIVAYAVDGRPEPKIAHTTPPHTTPTHLRAEADTDQESAQDYTPSDDTSSSTGDEFTQLAVASLAAAQRVGRNAKHYAGKAKQLVGRLKNKLKHLDRSSSDHNSAPELTPDEGDTTTPSS
ncbi:MULTISPECIES: hypothetical protein [unclassified Corynebacterium]|uniref:DUF6928 family protein n=1 Tax=unclassified Corynebacterium TaxID=2624378 RepID=UPI00163D90DE|nr:MULTISPECIES: hypothetical protein [unclassified Corynebacterium]